MTRYGFISEATASASTTGTAIACFHLPSTSIQRPPLATAASAAKRYMSTRLKSSRQWPQPAQPPRIPPPSAPSYSVPLTPFSSQFVVSSARPFPLLPAFSLSSPSLSLGIFEPGLVSGNFLRRSRAQSGRCSDLLAGAAGVGSHYYSFVCLYACMLYACTLVSMHALMICVYILVCVCDCKCMRVS